METNEDPGGTIAYDFLTVDLYRIRDGHTERLLILSNLDTTVDWVQSASLAVSPAFIGEEIQVMITGTTDDLWHTNFFLDDIELTVVSFAPGDVTADGVVSLEDTIVALQVLAGEPPTLTPDASTTWFEVLEYEVDWQGNPVTYTSHLVEVGGDEMGSHYFDFDGITTTQEISGEVNLPFCRATGILSDSDHSLCRYQIAQIDNKIRVQKRNLGYLLNEHAFCVCFPQTGKRAIVEVTFSKIGGGIAQLMIAQYREPKLFVYRSTQYPNRIYPSARQSPWTRNLKMVDIPWRCGWQGGTECDSLLYRSWNDRVYNQRVAQRHRNTDSFAIGALCLAGDSHEPVRAFA